MLKNNILKFDEYSDLSIRLNIKDIDKFNVLENILLDIDGYNE
jgi:hypothetical protein